MARLNVLMIAAAMWLAAPADGAFAQFFPDGQVKCSSASRPAAPAIWWCAKLATN